MLSYRHAFHAGNSADVLKHFVLVQVLAYLRQKNKPFDYVDTHSGAGYYSLQSLAANTTAEYVTGIQKLWQSPLESSELTDFIAVIDSIIGSNRESYPGSPAIAAKFILATDKAWLFELHPEDYLLLQQAFWQSNFFIRQEDGFRGLLGLLPPAKRRACILIDPSYEIKQDYQQVVAILKQAWRIFATGVYLLWYPVVNRTRINQLENQLKQSGIKNIHLYELATRKDSNDYGMTASGMIVINPPWVLKTIMDKVLPELLSLLAEDKDAGYRSEILVEQ